MSDLNEGTKQCTNCKQNINNVNFLTHEAFCRRNIILCDQCNKPFDKNKKEEHFEEFHAKIKCECGELVEKLFINEHKEKTCKKRQAQCFYCDLSLDFDKIQDHIEFCGSRTEQCNNCKRFIQKKDNLKHESTNCAYPPQPIKSNQTITSSNSDNTIHFSRQRQVPTNNPNQTNYRNYNQRITSAGQASLTLLPCEFCSEFFTGNELIQHQSECDLNYSNRTNNALNDNFVVSNSNNFNYLPRDAQSNIQRFRDEIFLNDSDSDDFSDFNDQFEKQNSINEKIPCEICNKLIDFDSIILHQSGCEASSNILANTRPHVNQILNDYDKKKSNQAVKPPFEFSDKRSINPIKSLNSSESIFPKTSFSSTIRKDETNKSNTKTVLKQPFFTELEKNKTTRNVKSDETKRNALSHMSPSKSNPLQIKQNSELSRFKQFKLENGIDAGKKKTPSSHIQQDETTSLSSNITKKSMNSTKQK